MKRANSPPLVRRTTSPIPKPVAAVDVTSSETSADWMVPMALKLYVSDTGELSDSLGMELGFVPFTVSVPVTVALPPNVGLKADSFRVPVLPSIGRKSPVRLADAVVVMSLMRMSAILGEG